MQLARLHDDGPELTTTNLPWNPLYGSRVVRHIPIDINGDGLQDILHVWGLSHSPGHHPCYFAGASLHLSTGEGFIGGMNGLPVFEGLGSVQERLGGAADPHPLDYYDFTSAVVSDVNQDGRDDLVVADFSHGVHVDSTDQELEGKWKVFYATRDYLGFNVGGDPFALPFASPTGEDLTNDGRDYDFATNRYFSLMPADLNGDFAEDFVVVFRNGPATGIDDSYRFDVHTLVRDQQAPYVITKIREGSIGLDPATAPPARWESDATYEIRYAPASNPKAYTHALHPNRPPKGDARPPLATTELERLPTMYLVTETRSDQGLTHPRPGETGSVEPRAPYVRQFTYHDSRYDRLWGWLGFRQVTETHPDAGKRITTMFEATDRRYEGPYVHHGFVPLLARPTRTYTDVDLPDGTVHRRFVHHDYEYVWHHGHVSYEVRESVQSKQTMECHADCDAEVSHWETVRSQSTAWKTYDDFGNPTLVYTDHGDGIEQERTTSYINDAGSWLIGLPYRETEIRSTGSASQSRTVQSTYHGGTRRLRRQERVDPDPTVKRATQYEYDDYGNLRQTIDIDAAGHIRAGDRTEYDDFEHIFPSQATNALGHRRLYQYDPGSGLLQTSVDPNDVATRWGYDGFGRVVRRELGSGEVQTTSYEPWNVGDYTLPSRVEKSNRGPERTVFLDRLNRPQRRERLGDHGRSIQVQYEYDQWGNKSYESLPRYRGEPAAGSFHFEYDGLGRLLSKRDHRGVGFSRVYRGTREWHTDARGVETIVDRDAKNRIARVQDAAGSILELSYQPFGPLGTASLVTHPAGLLRRQEHDAYGRLRRIEDADSGVTTFTHNGLDQLESRTDAAGNPTRYHYDPLDRLVARDDKDGTARWEYDTDFIGALGWERSAWGHEATYVRDTRGRLIESQTTVAGQRYDQRFSYDATGRLRTRVFPNHHSGVPVALQYAYGPEGLLDEVVHLHDPSQRFFSRKDTNAQGHLTAFRLGEKIGVQRSYDPVTSLLRSIRSAAGDDLQQLSYDYDDNGNLLQRATQRGSAVLAEVFEYDELDRLRTAAVSMTKGGVTKPGGTLEYRYGPTGNLTYSSKLGAYDYEPDQPHAVIKVGPHEFDYDAVGDQIRRNDTKIDYSAAHKPVRIETGTGDVIEYEYDAWHHRVIERHGLTGTVYIGKDYEKRLRGVKWHEKMHVRVEGKTVATVTVRDDGADVRVQYLLQDHLGSPHVITDVHGQPEQELYFDAFGRSREKYWQGDTTDGSEFGDNRIGFGGHEQDAVAGLGLVNMGGRIYDPEIGRFLSQDPAIVNPYDLQHYNRYSYVLNNPLSLIDPTGYHVDDFSRGNPQAERFGGGEEQSDGSQPNTGDRDDAPSNADGGNADQPADSSETPQDGEPQDDPPEDGGDGGDPPPSDDAGDEAEPEDSGAEASEAPPSSTSRRPRLGGGGLEIPTRIGVIRLKPENPSGLLDVLRGEGGSGRPEERRMQGAIHDRAGAEQSSPGGVEAAGEALYGPPRGDRTSLDDLLDLGTPEPTAPHSDLQRALMESIEQNMDDAASGRDDRGRGTRE